MKTKQYALVIDDDELMRLWAAQTLIAMGFSTKTCSSAEEAADKINDEEFDLILSDHHMPTMSGLELLAKIRARYFGKFILMTGDIDRDLQQTAHELGVDGFVEKLFCKPDLERVIGIRRNKE